MLSDFRIFGIILEISKRITWKGKFCFIVSYDGTVTLKQNFIMYDLKVGLKNSLYITYVFRKFGRS